MPASHLGQHGRGDQRVPGQRCVDRAPGRLPPTPAIPVALAVTTRRRQCRGRLAQRGLGRGGGPHRLDARHDTGTEPAASQPVPPRLGASAVASRSGHQPATSQPGASESAPAMQSPTGERDPARRSRRLRAGWGPDCRRRTPVCAIRAPRPGRCPSGEGRAGLPRGQVRGVRHPPGPPPPAGLSLRRDGLRLLARPRLLAARAALGAARVTFQAAEAEQERGSRSSDSIPRGCPSATMRTVPRRPMGRPGGDHPAGNGVPADHRRPARHRGPAGPLQHGSAAPADHLVAPPGPPREYRMAPSTVR